MAFLNTGAAAAAAWKAAEATVKASWLSKNRVLSDAEISQMSQEILAAGLNALFAHLSATMQVNGVAAVGLVAPPGGGPVTGAVVLPPGSIT